MLGQSVKEYNVAAQFLININIDDVCRYICRGAGVTRFSLFGGYFQ